MASSPSPAALQHIVQRLQQTDDARRRYEYLLWLSRRLPAFPESARVPENQVKGCLAQVYLTATLDEGKVMFQGDSDAQITRGLVALLIEGLNGQPPAAILQVTPDFIQDTGLTTSLTPARVNGFYNIFRAMQKKAMEFAEAPGDQAEKK